LTAHIKGIIMSTFINTPYATEHPGVQRAESAIQGALLLRQRWSAFSGLVALLLTAVVAAVLVVAYQVMDSVVEGHLLVLWMALWALAFAAMALYSGTARNLVKRGKASLDRWADGQARARADERLWVIAKSDSRVMADLHCAITRQQSLAGADDSVSVSSAAVAPSGLSARAIRLGGADLQAYKRQNS
jgi:hypothetical protein